MTESSLPEESIFMQALEIPSAPERAAYLDRACGEDRDLRAAVEALLRANDRSGDLLDLPEKRGGTIDEPAVGEHPGTVIGPYKLLQQIGEGGMGTVFMAEQAQPVQRKVALKIIKAGMDSHQVIARFEAERQALALMDHPNIARVLEAGTTNSGRPYFVMDLVKGVPITRYCDEHHLTLRERLELFVPVCQAIQHAHQKGIIHRDIKPSNVLVALYDGKPVPKVIDFGVAKAAGPKLTEKTLFTEFGQVVGTLEYMSPEQAELNQLDIDTRSDIYSLGVLLYELLTGTTPLERQRFKEVAFLEVLRLIREEESPKPSTRLSTSQELPSIAANRGLEPKKLNGLVRGELDWIVMKALEKDRSRRYETGNALARDVERYLHDEAVEACPPSARYRLRKFARKNRTALSVAAAFVLLLCGGVLVSTSQAIRAGKATERAENEARMASAINDFLQNDLLRPVSNAEKGGPGLANPNLTVKEVLDRAAVRLGSVRFRDQPLVEAAIRYAIGQAYVDIGLARLGVPHLERCWALRQRQLDPDHPLTLTTMTSLGTAYKAAGKFDQAVATFEQILARFRRNYQATWPIMGQLARAYQAAGKFDQAVALLQQRLTKDKAERPGNPETHYGMSELAVLYRDLGKYEQAEKLWLEMVAAKSTMWGAAHIETLNSKHNLADMYESQGKWDLAEKLLQEVIDAKITNLGTDDDSTLLSKNDLAVLYTQQGKWDLAETLMQEVLDASTTKLGTDHPKTLGRMTWLARTYQNVGKLDKALPLFKQTLEKCKANLGPDHPDTLQSMNDLARAYQAAGKLDQALELFEQTLQKCKVNLGPDHPDTLKTMTNLASAYRAAGKFDQAQELFKQTLEKCKLDFSSTQLDKLDCMDGLATAYQDAGEFDKALSLFTQTFEQRKLKLGPDNRNVLNSINNLANAYQDAGKFDKALPLLQEALERQRKNRYPDSNVTGAILVTLGRNLLTQKKYAEAEPVFHEGLTIREKQQPNAWTTFLTKSLLGSALLGQKKYADAEPLLLAGYEGMKQREAKITALYRLHLTEALTRVVDLYEACGQNDKADAWRQKLQAHVEAEKKSAKPKEK